MKKETVIVGVLLFCLLIAWIWTEHRNAHALSPSPSETNLVAFLNARPQSHEIRKFDSRGKGYLEVIGKPIVSPLSFPSGPPVYIFDDTGALVDWTPDYGDTPSFVSRWSSMSNATPISAAEAKRWVEAYRH